MTSSPSIETSSTVKLPASKVLVATLSKLALSIVSWLLAILVIVAESIFALVPVIAFAVSTEFAIFVIVALSPNAESKFINSVENCLISELSAFKVLIVALSDVICEDVNWVFA